MYAHFTETLTGLATIRAYHVQDRFINRNADLIITNYRAYGATIWIQRWLGVRLETCANLLA